jgi:hypothetical protein
MTLHRLADGLLYALQFVPYLLTLPARKTQPASCGSAYDLGSWRDVPVTFDQLRIERHLSEISLRDRKILHVGVGSSRVAAKFHRQCHLIDGITVMEDEVSHAESLGISNYRVYLMDKYGDSILGLPNKYHYILDNNPSSYAPHRDAMQTMFTRYIDLLEDGGAVVTDTLGMQHHRPFAFPIDDDDLMAFERKLPVKYVKVNRTVRALIKNVNA